jgi:glycosyltransferase involved in cell wall biosynthesis
MKVLIISPYAAPHVGGIESMISQEIQVLLRHGHEVVLLTSTCGNDNEVLRSEYQANCTIYRIASWNILEKKLHISWPLFSPSLLLALWRHTRWCDIVHVHGHLFMPSPIALLLAKILKKPNVLSMHGRTVHYQTLWKNGLQAVAQQTLARISFKCARNITTQVESDIPLLQQQVGRNTRIQLILNPLPGSGFYPPTPEQRKNARLALSWNDERIKVLFVGSIRPTKGCDLLLDAYSPDYDIVFCGVCSPEYRQKIDAAGMHYLPPRELQDMVTLYHACDMVILPSYSEGNPLAVSEALMCNRPVVLGRYQGSEIFENTGLQAIYFCDHSAISVKETIKHVIQNLAAAQAMDSKTALEALFPTEDKWTKTILELAKTTAAQ